MMDDINAPTVTIGALTDTGLLTTGAFNWEHTLNTLNLESGGTAGSVTIGGNITKGTDDGSVANTATGALTVLAGSNIVQNASSAISSSSTYGKLNTIFDSDYAGNDGYILLSSGASITSNGGNITLGGGSNPATGYAVTPSSSFYGIELVSNNTLNAGAGTITMNGDGNSVAGAAVYLAASSLIETTSGSILMNGQNGHYSMDMSGTVTTNSGSITINGTTMNVPNCFNCIGVLINTGAVISSTGSGAGVGAITITGVTHPNGSPYTNGIQESGTISSVDANIILNGSSNSATPYTLASGFGVGLTVNGTVTSTGSGAISITGVGDINGDDQVGIFFDSGTTSAHNGSITISGTSGGYGTVYSGGIVFYNDNNQILSTGTAPITLTGIGVAGSSDISINTTGNVIGGSSANGNITFNANSIDYTAPNTIETAQQVIFAPRTASTTIGVAGGSGSLSIGTGILGDITAGSLTIGSTSGTGNIDVGAQTLPANELLQSGSGNITFDGIQTLGAKSLTAATTSGNITLDQNDKITSTASSGNSIVLAAGGNFINNDTDDGSGALNAGSGTARYLVYSTNPSLNTMGGLSDAGPHHLFDRSYTSDPPVSVTQSSNQFIYASDAPLVDSPVFSTTVSGAVDHGPATSPAPDLTYLAGPQPAGAYAPRGSGYFLGIDAALLHQLNLKENDPHPWWDGVIQTGVQ
jgi:hypothetical protein